MTQEEQNDFELEIFYISEGSDEIAKEERQEVIRVYKNILGIEDDLSNGGKFENFNKFTQEHTDKLEKRKKINKAAGLDEATSNQSNSELSSEHILSLFGKIAPVPYDPYDFSCLLDTNPTHKQACQVKSRDSVGRNYKIKPTHPIEGQVSDLDEHDLKTSKEDFSKDCRLISDFIENCSNQMTFQQEVYLTAYDREAIGWTGIEVIRNLGGKACKIRKIPGRRLRTLENFEGFVEIRDGNESYFGHSQYTYYQPFGEKIKVKIMDPDDERKIANGEISEDEVEFYYEQYDPNKHGELDRIENDKLEFNLVSKYTGQPIEFTAENFKEHAANEVLFFQKEHPNTVYYGQSDISSALNAVRAIYNIDQFLDNFFKNNCVPRWAVLIEGPRVNPKVKQEIAKYFQKEVKGENGQTMVLSVPNQGGKDSKITFKKLDTDIKEADFQQTRKDYRQDIITAHGVPPTLLTIVEAANMGSGKGTAQSEQYKDRFIVPAQIYWAAKLNKLFKLGLGVIHAKIEFDPLDVRDSFFAAQALNLYLQSGVLTPNEARNQLNLEPVEGGDNAFIRASNTGVLLLKDIESSSNNPAEMPSNESFQVPEMGQNSEV